MSKTDKWHDFYSSQTWKDFVKAYKKKHPHCIVCGKRTAVAHHIIEFEKCDFRENGGVYDEWNLQPMCRHCHQLEHINRTINTMLLRGEVAQIVKRGYSSVKAFGLRHGWWREDSTKGIHTHKIYYDRFWEWVCKNGRKADTGLLMEKVNKKKLPLSVTPEDRALMLIYDLRKIDTQSEQTSIRLQYVSGGQL